MPSRPVTSRRLPKEGSRNSCAQVINRGLTKAAPSIYFILNLAFFFLWFKLVYIPSCWLSNFSELIHFESIQMHLQLLWSVLYMAVPTFKECENEIWRGRKY